MATYQIINLQTGEFQTLSLEEVAEIAQLDPHEIKWAIKEHGVCETEIHQITKLNDPPEGNGNDASDGSADNCAVSVIPVFVYINQADSRRIWRSTRLP